MALTVEEMGTLRDALVRAMSSGTLTLRHGDRLITYRSYAEMEKALGLLDAQISSAGGVTRVRSVRLIARESW